MIIKQRTGDGYKNITVEEVQNRINEGDFGMLTFLKGYYIDGVHCFAHGLTLFPKETKIRAGKDDKSLIVSAHFKEMLLSPKYSTGNPNDLVAVEVEIKDLEHLCVTFKEN